MKAVQMSRFGGPEVLELIDLPTPAPGSGEVLVRVHAAGVNFAETLMRQDRYAVKPDLPTVLGSEIAGTVAAIGPDVNGLAVGQRVAAPLFAAGRYHGGYAEYAVIEAPFVVPLPDEISFAVATALTVQGLTALYLLRQADPKGKTVLVNAAAGGVGSLLVQLAKRADARAVVAAAGSESKLTFARSLGADAGIDYSRADWSAQVKDVLGGTGPGIIYESVGGDVMRACLGLLAPVGEMVVYGALNIQDFHLGVPELLGLIFRNQSLTGFALAPLLTPDSLRMALGELFDLAADGRLKVTIGGSYPLARAADAHRALEGRSTIGKLVLEP